MVAISPTVSAALRMTPAGKPAGAGTGGGSGGAITSQQVLALLRSTLGRPDPGLAATSPGAIGRTVQQDVSAQVDPYLASIAARYAGQTDGGAKAIEGATTAYSDAVKPIAGREQAIGDEAATQSMRESDALAKFLSSSGAATDNEVGAKLDAAGVPASAAGPMGMGAGAGAITAASGYAAGHDASTEGMDNAKLAALLPGFATLAGENAEGNFRNTQAQSQAAEMAGVTNQVPGLVRSSEQHLEDNELTKAGQRVSGRQNAASTIGSFLSGVLGNENTSKNDAADRATQMAIAELTSGTDLTKANQPQVIGSGSTGYFTYDPATGVATPLGDTGTHPPAPKPLSPASKTSAIDHADSVTRSILKDALKPPKKAADPFAPGSTAAASSAKPRVGEAAYNAAVNRAVTSIAPALEAVGYTREQIVKFVQERALVAGFAAAPAPAPPAPSRPFGNNAFAP